MRAKRSDQQSADRYYILDVHQPNGHRQFEGTDKSTKSHLELSVGHHIAEDQHLLQ